MTAQPDHSRGSRTTPLSPTTLYRAFAARRARKAVHAPERGISADDRWRLVRRHGDFPLAFPLAVDPDLLAFGDDAGAIAFAQEAGFTFALGDPVAAPADRGRLLDAFVATFRDPVFVAAQRPTAAHLAGLGYRVSLLGHDSVIDLNGLDFSGGRFKRIRYATSWLRARGGSVVEDPADGSTAADVRALTQDWRASRVSSRELRFISRGLPKRPEPDTRRFLALSAEGDPLGLAGFDPVYEDGRITGHLASQKRRRADDGGYVDLAIMRHALQTFRDEGRRSVFLGLSPLADLGPSGFHESRWLRWALSRAGRSDRINGGVFNSRGLTAHKARFRGRPVPLYLCLPPGGPGLMRMIALLVLTKVV